MHEWLKVVSLITGLTIWVLAEPEANEGETLRGDAR